MKEDIGNRTASLLSEAQHGIRTVSEGDASIGVEGDIDKDHNGSPASTIVVQIGEDRFAAYSTGSMASLQAYLRGFSHAMSLVCGNYTFKPLSEGAGKRKRESVTRWKEDSRKWRMYQFQERCGKIAGSPPVGLPDYLEKASRPEHPTRGPRFALWRNRFNMEE